MNKVILVGRLTKDPDVRYSEDRKCSARYSLAVQRSYKNSNGQYDADFINCIAFGRTAEFAEKWLKKGSKISIIGSIRTGNYTNKEGQKVYTTDVVVEENEFVESKSEERREQPSDVGEGFMSIPDSVEDEGLPFN